MRLFHLLMIPLLSLLTFVVAAVDALTHRFAGHLRLMPSTPRSVIESRRLGLC